MEPDDRELAGASRSAHVLHITPRIGGESERLVQSTFGRISTRPETGVALVAIVPDRDTAYEVVGFARAENADGAHVVPLTTPARAAKLLAQDPGIIVGTAGDLLALVRTTHLKLERVRHALLLWPDSILLDERQSSELETLLAELPRDTERTIIAERESPELESLIERVALKPRRITHASTEIPARQLGYVIVAAEQRNAALQRLIDARDAADVVVVADDDKAAGEALQALTALGEGAVSLLAPAEIASASLIVWYGPPRGPARVAELLAAADASSEVVLLATPAELRRMRALSASLTFNPVSFAQATDAAAQRVKALRDELSGMLRREPMDAELAILEPLLVHHDAAEVAAAALRLLGRARQAAARAEQVERSVASAPKAGHASASEENWTRLFLNVGERDGVRRGDLVGAITGEASIPGSQVGKITLHESYSLVEVAHSVADHVMERLTGVSIRGRRVSARLDRAGARGVSAEVRRGARRELSDTPQPPRGPRATREHEEWSSRGERLRHARRPSAEPPSPGGEP